MFDPDMEEYRRDAERDAIYDDYRVLVGVVFSIKTSAKSRDEAESEAYDTIEEALRGKHLDYDFKVFETEKWE